MKKFMTAAALTLMASAGAGAVSADAASTTAAPAAHPAAIATPARAASARVTVNEAARIVTLERVYGSNYRIYKERYPNALNWNNNGCSVPFSVPISNHYKNLFQKSCDRHDFGYRNHGKSGYSRETVDNRFHSNMDYQCVVVYDDPWDLPARGAC